MPAERKSVEPIAALTAPKRVSAQHQSLLQFVGVARQYCGQLGKQDNCQVAVSLSLAYARAQHLAAITGHVLEENMTMVRMCAEMGFKATTQSGEPGVVHVLLELGAAPA